MKIFSTLFFFIFSCFSHAISVPTCNISLAEKKIVGNVVSCDICISAPSNWKFPKAPEISIKNSSDFYDVKQSMVSSNPSFYKFHISAKKTYINTMALKVESAICSNICVLATNDINVNFGSNFVIFLYMLLGFAGGLLLNIMPCVLPVILMKLRAFKTRMGLLGSIAGNFAAFSVLIISLIFFKIMGDTAGWGMHFQSTTFLAIVACILFLLTLSAFNIIHLNISWNMKYNTASIFWKNFISAVVSTFVAVPCVAPFLGVAATFAIQGSIPQLIAVFLSITTGFSFPYIFVLLFKIKIPNIPRHISYVFDKIAGGGVLITLLWVVWLLFQNIKAPESHFEQIYAQMQTNIEQKNKVVILNITAKWCLTCKYNHRRIFRNEQIKRMIKQDDIDIIEVDITKKDEAVTKFLHQHNRVGIPFMMVYGPKSKEGILLEEIPSINDVIKAINDVK